MQSPCVKNCVIDPDSGYCAGCWRTLAEIAAWATLSAAERQRIMLTLASRRPQARNG